MEDDLFVCFEGLFSCLTCQSTLFQSCRVFLNQYYAKDEVPCSRTQHSDSAGCVSNQQPFDPQSSTLPTEPLCSSQEDDKGQL